MIGMRRFFKICRYFLLGLVLVVAIASCDTALLTRTEPLASVESLPLPQLPDWIEQISPTGEAAPLAQIRIRFKEPLIPVESLDSSDQQYQLKQFELTPPLPGQFRFLTPRMVGFQADQAIPNATRLKVTLKAGLADLSNHRLEQDLAWTFNTPPILLYDLPGIVPDSGTEVDPIDLKPTLEVASNTELDLASLQEHVSLIPNNNSQDIGMKVALKKNETESETTNSPQATFDPSQQAWIYTLTPERELAKGTPYRLQFAPGLRPARGNLPSETPFVSEVKTYGPLTFERLQYMSPPDAGGAYGRFVQGSAQLQFNNGLVVDSVRPNITITPVPKETPPPFQIYEGDRFINLNPWSLAPNTTYTITLGANLKDKFGQTLGKPVTLEYKTGDVAAALWAPSDLHIFPANTDLQLNLSAVNLPDSSYKAAYRVLQPTDLVYTESAYPLGEGNDWLPNKSTWQSFPASGSKNQTTEIAVPLQEKLGNTTGLLAYGVTARAYRYQQEGQSYWYEPEFYGLVHLTDLGVFAQWFPESGLVRVNRLSDGSAVGGATVDIYESKLGAKARPKPSPCATGTTDPSGTLVLNREAIQSCMAGGQAFKNPPNLLTIVRDGEDWSFSRTLEWSGDYGYGIYAGWNGSTPESRGTIFSDRQLYQPGETAWFTGVAYYLQNGAIRQAQNTPYTLTLEDPDGNTINLGTQTTNPFGTFSLEWTVPANQTPGYYNLRAVGENGVEIAGEFRVAEFKPPNFKVDLALDKPFAVIGETVSAQAQSNYLFGPAVEDGKAEYYVTREQTDFTPQGWEQFSFGRRWFWPEETPSVPADVLQVTTALDQQGKGTQSVKVADDLPYPMTYRLDVQVTDVSNLSVANSQTFVALPGDRLIGLKSNFVADAGKPFDVQVIVTNPQGEAMGNQSVHLELQQMIYSSVTQVIEGSDTARDQVEYKTVAAADVRSASEAKAVSLTAPESGSYRIRAHLGNSRNEATATDIQIWVTGANPVSWGGRYDNERLELQLDKETYRPGETATVLIQSPYPDAELYLAVIRHNTLYKTITKVQGGAPQVQFQVTPEMLPNAAVQAVLVRQGVALNLAEPGSVENLVRIGFAPFAINLDDQYLQVTETVRSPSLQPGTEQTIDLELRDAQGQPVQGQFTVMVVNEAVLQLTGYRPPDLVETVYAEQPISTRFRDNRPDVVLSPLSSPLRKGWGYGGGLSAGVGSNRVRTDFKPLAYYNGSVLADASGRASISFKLPDDLTTWRVMAVATDGQFHFGNGDATFITTKPLITNPILPQFARPGDRLEAGISVTNTTGQPLDITINGSLTPGESQDGAATPQTPSVQFVSNNQTQLTAALQTQAGTGTSAYRFPMVAGGTGESSVQFSTQATNGSDAFALPLTVKPLEITEQVVETGVTTTSVQIPIKVDDTVVNDTGGLEVSLASTLIPQLTAPVQDVVDGEQLPFLEPIASRLAIAAHLKVLAQTYGQTVEQFNPSQQATQALSQLQPLQRPDGGFAAYPGQDASDPLISPYAAEAIAAAKQAGLTVNTQLVDRLQDYMAKILADPGQYDFCKEQRCKDQVRLRMLMGLSALGDRRNQFLADLYDRRSQFDPVTQIKLARYLTQFPEWQQEAGTLATQLQETVYETARTATVNLPQGWGWLSSPTTAQAQALRLFIARQADPAVIDRLVQGLLSLRRNGTWSSTYDTAEAFTALVDYSQLQPTPPSFTAIADLAGTSITSQSFKGYEQTSVDVTVPMAQLPPGESTLTLRKNGEGTLHYLAAYRYRLQGNPPGQLNGLRVTRTIRSANAPEVLKQIGLYDTDKPLTVKPGQVFDVALEVITDHPVDHLVITDPLPAGFEAVDTSFQTATPHVQAQGDSWQISYQTIYADRVLAFGDRLDAGVYTLHYLVRSITPGTFLYPGAEAHLQYAPEEFGRSAASTLVVAE